jgi:multisubunit Na+/H+ antiporter MnhC subunit
MKKLKEYLPGIITAIVVPGAAITLLVVIGYKYYKFYKAEQKEVSKNEQK